MTRWAIVRRAALVALVCGGGSSRAQAQVFSGPSDAPASVEKDRIIIAFPLPYEGMRGPIDPVTGYFVWRVTVTTRQPFSLVVTSDTVLRSDSPTQILRASTVRLCADPGVESARSCTAPVDASLEVSHNRFRVVITDAELLERVRRDRPEWYSRYVVVPGGRFLSTQHRFRY